MRTVLLAACVVLTGRAFAQPAVSYNYPGNPMPALRIAAADTPSARYCREHPDKVTRTHARIYTEKDFDYKGPLFVMLFNPNCSHCEDQAEALMKRIDELGKAKAKVVMITDTTNSVYLPNFIAAFKIAEHKDVVTIGTDIGDYIKNAFLYQSLPQISVYSADRKLVRNYSGGVAIDSLVQYLR